MRSWTDRERDPKRKLGTGEMADRDERIWNHIAGWTPIFLSPKGHFQEDGHARDSEFLQLLLQAGLGFYGYWNQYATLSEPEIRGQVFSYSKMRQLDRWLSKLYLCRQKHLELSRLQKTGTKGKYEIYENRIHINYLEARQVILEMERALIFLTRQAKRLDEAEIPL